MAKSKVKKVSIGMGQGAELADFPKTMHIEMEADELNALKQSKVGDEIVLVVKGTLKSLSQNSRKTDSGTETTGTAVLEDFDVEVGSDKIWGSLADDSDDD